MQRKELPLAVQVRSCLAFALTAGNWLIPIPDVRRDATGMNAGPVSLEPIPRSPTQTAMSLPGETLRRPTIVGDRAPPTTASANCGDRCGPTGGCDCTACHKINVRLGLAQKVMHAHPHGLMQKPTTSTIVCNVCLQTITKGRFSCASCNHDECLSCSALTGSVLFNNDRVMIKKFANGYFYCGRKAGYFNNCKKCDGTCGPNGCCCTSCHVANVANGIRDYVHPGGAPMAIGGTVRPMQSTPVMQSNRSASNNPAYNQQNNQMGALMSRFFRPPTGTPPPNTTANPNDPAVLAQFVGIGVVVCKKCHSMSFPVCPTHNYLLCNREQEGTSCPIQGCSISTPDSSSVCIKCSEPGNIVAKKLFISRGESNFAARGADGENLTVIPMLLFSCPSCRTLEFPGFRDSLITLLDIMVNETALQILKANLIKFKHRCTNCPSSPTIILAHIEKAEASNLNLYVAHTLNRMGPSDTQLSVGELLLNTVDNLDELEWNPSASSEADDDDKPDDKPEENSQVQTIRSISQFNQFVAGSAHVAVLFWANWSQPSKVFKPRFEELASGTSALRFATFDCFAHSISESDRSKILQRFSINSYPTTIVFDKGVEHDRINGAGQATLLLNNIINDLAGVTHNEFTEQLVKLGNLESANVQMKFHNSMGGMYPDLKFKVLAVYKVTNKTLSDRFEAKRAALKCNPVEAFHATKSGNVQSICSNNVSMGKIGQTDKGYFGAGLYFSQYADYTFAYAHDSTARPIKAGEKGTVIMFNVLLGKTYRVQNLTLGASKMAGYDSHVSPKECEWIIFDNTQCVPVYVFEFEAEVSVKAKVGGAWEK
ncbi:hypothetical protein BDR26DRAFT_891409 [Obelidium mucronatum]|nr:hypothetical protein BDR26DRAFT_891404 [Obelidium mucronatum]KAI9350087.1 hypothetical protein BDR26DRAFT_891409 [Obelidium mucronatum]